MPSSHYSTPSASPPQSIYIMCFIILGPTTELRGTGCTNMCKGENCLKQNPVIHGSLNESLPKHAEMQANTQALNTHTTLKVTLVGLNLEHGTNKLGGKQLCKMKSLSLLSYYQVGLLQVCKQQNCISHTLATVQVHRLSAWSQKHSHGHSAAIIPAPFKQSV